VTHPSESPVPKACAVCRSQMMRAEVPYLVETMSGPVIIERVPVVRCVRCGRRTFAPEVMDHITAMLLEIEHGTLQPPKVPTGRVQFPRSE
jgi:hypothetical protein